MDKSNESNPTTNKNNPGEQDTNNIPNPLHINTIPEFISTPTNPIRIGSVLHTFLENNDPSCQRPCCVFPMEPVSLKQNNAKNKPIPTSKIPTVRKLVKANILASVIAKGKTSYKQKNSYSNASKNVTGGLNTKNINANLEIKKLPEIIPVIPDKQIVELYSKAIGENKVVSPRISNCSSTASCNRPSLIPVKIQPNCSRNEKNLTDQEKPRKTGYDPKKTLKKVVAEKNLVRKSYIREIFAKNDSRIPVRVSSRNESNLKAGTSLSKPENFKIETKLFPDVISKNISNSSSRTYISLPEAKETQQFDVHDLDTMSFQDIASKILSLCPDMISNGVVTLPGRKVRHTGHSIEDFHVSNDKTNEIQVDSEEKLIEHQEEQNTKCANEIIINPTRESGIADNVSSSDVVAIAPKMSSTTRIRMDLSEIAVDVDESHKIIIESEKKENKKESELVNEELVADSPTSTCTKDQTLLLPEVEQLATANKPYFNSTDEKIHKENKRNWLIRSLHISLAAREGFIDEIDKMIKKAHRILLGRYQKLFMDDKDEAQEHKNPSEKDLIKVLKSYAKFVFSLNDYYGKCLEDIRNFEKLDLCNEGTNSSKFYHETTMNIEGRKLSGIFIPVSQSTPTFNTDSSTNDNIDDKECKISKMGKDDSESSLKETCPPVEMKKYEENEEFTLVEIKPVEQLNENNEVISFESDENCNSDLKGQESQEFGIIDFEINKHEKNEEVTCVEIKPVVQLSENKELSVQSEKNCNSDFEEQEFQEFNTIEDCTETVQLQSTLVSASSENNAVSRKRSSADIFTNCSNNMIRKKQRKNTKNRKRFPKTNFGGYGYPFRSEPSTSNSSRLQINIPWSTNVGDSINLHGFAIDEMVENLWRDIDMQALGMDFDVLNPIVEELEVLPGNNNVNSFITDELDLPVNDSDDGNDFIVEEIEVHSSAINNYENSFIPEELKLQFENNDENYAAAVEEIETPFFNTDDRNSMVVGNFEALLDFNIILPALQYWNNFSLLQDTYNYCNKDLNLKHTLDFVDPHGQNQKQLLVSLPSICSSLFEYGEEIHYELIRSSPKNKEICTKRNFSNNFSTSDNNSLIRIFPDFKSDIRLTSFWPEKILMLMSTANLCTLPLIQNISFSNYFFDFYTDIGNSNLQLSIYTCNTPSADHAKIDNELKTPETLSTEIIPLHDSQKLKTKVRIVALEQFYEKDVNYDRISLVQNFSTRKVSPLKSKLIALENIPGNCSLSTSIETIGKQTVLKTIEESSEEGEQNFLRTPREERFPSYFNCDSEEVELLNEENSVVLEEKKSQEENKSTNTNFTRAACFNEDLEINDFYIEEIIDTEPEESEKDSSFILEQLISSIPKQDLSSKIPSNHEIDNSSYDKVSYEYCSDGLDLLMSQTEENQENTRIVFQTPAQIKCDLPNSQDSSNNSKNSQILVEDQTFVNEIEISCEKSNSDRDLRSSTMENESSSTTKIHEAPSVNKETSFIPQQPPVVSIPSSSSFLLVTSESTKNIDPNQSDELHPRKQPVRIMALRSFHSLPLIVDANNDIINDSPEFQRKSIPMIPQKLKPPRKPLSTSLFTRNSRCAANLGFSIPETPIPTTPAVIPSLAILYKKSVSFTNCTETRSIRKPTIRSDGKYNKYGWKLNRDPKTDFTEKLRQLSTLANNNDNLSHEKTCKKSRIPRFQPKTDP